MPTIFTRILDGELPGAFVWRDDRCAGLLSINPITPGHTLVVPIDEVDHWIDLPADLAAHLFEVARVIGQAQQQAYGCERIGMIIAGYEVPHCHLHVIPTEHMGHLSFAAAAPHVERSALDAEAARIRTALVAMGRREVPPTS